MAKIVDLYHIIDEQMQLCDEKGMALTPEDLDKVIKLTEEFRAIVKTVKTNLAEIGVS